MISVIIPTSNRKELLKRATRSVLKQTFRKFECIIVDDGSKIPAAEVLGNFEDKRIKHIRLDESQGASAARNYGLQASSGKYIAFLDDDDEWLPTKLELQRKKIKRADQETALIHCWMTRINDRTGKVDATCKPQLSGDIFGTTLDKQPLGNVSCWLIRRNAIIDVNGFDKRLPRGNDGDLLRRLSRSYKVDYVPRVLVKYHVNHGSKRITEEDEKGIKFAIRGKKRKLVKFENELNNFPEMKANIMHNISIEYFKINHLGKALKYLSAAHALNPNLPKLLNSFKSILKHKIL